MKDITVCSYDIYDKLISYVQEYCDNDAGISLILCLDIDYGPYIKTKEFLITDWLTKYPTVDGNLWYATKEYCMDVLNLRHGDEVTYTVVVKSNLYNNSIMVFYLSVPVAISRNEFNAFIEETSTIIAEDISDVIELEESYNGAGFYCLQECKRKENEVVVVKKLAPITYRELRVGIDTYNSYYEFSAGDFVKPIVSLIDDEYEELLGLYLQSLVFQCGIRFCICMNTQRLTVEQFAVDFKECSYISFSPVNDEIIAYLKGNVFRTDKPYSLFLFLMVVDREGDEILSKPVARIEFGGLNSFSTIANEVIGEMNKLMNIGSTLDLVNPFEIYLGSRSLPKEIEGLVRLSSFDNVSITFKCLNNGASEHYLVPLQARDSNDGFLMASHRLMGWCSCISLRKEYYDKGGCYDISITLVGVNFNQVVIAEVKVKTLEEAIAFRESIYNNELLSSLKTYVQKNSGLQRFN